MSRTRDYRLLLIATIPLLAALACSTLSTARPAPVSDVAESPAAEATPIPPGLAAEETPPPEPEGNPLAESDLPTFEGLVKEATIARDVEAMGRLMRDRSFVIAGWQSEGNEWTPEEGARHLVDTFLLPDNPVLFVDDADPVALLGGTDPLAIWGSDVNAVSALYTQGWGEGGAGEALLIIAEHPDGGYYWRAALVALGGFGMGGQTTDNIALRESFENEVMRAVVERDFEAMPALMSDPFTINAWQAGGVEWSPVEAAAQLQVFYPPEGNIITFGGPSPDLSALLGQDPVIFFGGGLSFLYSVGWGPGGAGEAILVIDATPEGALYWSAILIAPTGF